MSNKQTTPEQPATDISIYIAALQATYRPASAPADATHFFSTADFDFCNRPSSHGLAFKWMFRER